MRKNNKVFWLTIASLLFFLQCANVVTPSGGPKDITPPVVLKVSPDNNSKNFARKNIQITFDEYVTLENPNKNILISPPLKENPEYKLNGKTLIINFKESLKPKTTYSINFNNAIKDIHEGNIFKGYVFVFSTGDVIDSLSLSGKLVSGFDLKPDEDFFVMLYYDDKDTIALDSLPYLSKPDYVTKTNKEGKFIFKGLVDKPYLIFALKDGNSNLKYDLPNEEIAFLDSLVHPVYIPENKYTAQLIDTVQLIDTTQQFNDSTLLIMYSFIQEDSIQKLLKKELVEEGLLRFIFRYPAKDVKIEVQEKLPDTFSIYQINSNRYDTILWYFTPNKDSLWVSINYDTLINDTVHFNLKPRTAEKMKRKIKTETAKRLNINNNTVQGELKPEQQLILSFKEPITRINMRDTTWFINSKDNIFNDLQFEKMDSFGLKYKLNKTFEPERSYQIIIPDSIFYSFNGLTNDTTKISFKISETSQFGNIYITVEVPEDVPQVIVELLDDRDKVIHKQIITETQEIKFLYLKPAKYKLKAIMDRDRNGIWSPGNFSKKILPERVYYYKDVLELRANWDIDLEEVWKFD